MNPIDEAIAVVDGLMEQQAREESELPAPPAMPEPVTAYTSIPRAWWGRELFDWGVKGLRVRGNGFVKAAGRRAKRWDRVWDGQVTRIRPGEDTGLLLALGEVTRERWTVYQRSGKFWRVAYHMVPTSAIPDARCVQAYRRHVRLQAEVDKARRRLESLR